MMIVRVLTILVCLLIGALAVCGALVYISQLSTVPMASRSPHVAKKVTAKHEPKKHSQVATSTGIMQPAVDEAAASSPIVPPPSLPGGPELGKQYTLAEAIKNLDDVRSKSREQPEFREQVNAWYVFLADPAFTQSASYQ